MGAIVALGFTLSRVRNLWVSSVKTVYVLILEGASMRGGDHG